MDETETARIRLAKGLWWETPRTDRSVNLACALGARMPRVGDLRCFFFPPGTVSEIKKQIGFCYPLPQLTRIGALSIACARRRMYVLNKYLPDPGSNGIRGKYLISAVYFLRGLASDVLLKTPARAGVVLKSPYEPRNKSAKNSHLPISRRPERRSRI